MLALAYEGLRPPGDAKKPAVTPRKTKGRNGSARGGSGEDTEVVQMKKGPVVAHPALYSFLGLSVRLASCARLADVRSLQTLPEPLNDVEFDGLASDRLRKPLRQDGGVVDEAVQRTITGDETKAAID